jgi:NHLM bacteriocin system ABC transporter ATP-binding protein
VNSTEATPNVADGQARQPRIVAPDERISITGGDAMVFIQKSDRSGRRIAVGQIKAPAVIVGASPPPGCDVILVPFSDCQAAPATSLPADTDTALGALIGPAVAAFAEADAAERDRLGRVAANQRLDVTSAIDAVAEVMDRPDKTGARNSTHLVALDAAMGEVGKYLGVRFPDLDDSIEHFEPIVDAANMAGCRARPVLLSGSWWSQAIEPVIAFRGDDAHPVACVPRSEGRYIVFDPTNDTRVPLERVTDLVTEGYAFTRPIPPMASSAKAFLRYAMRNARSTLRTLILAGFLAAMAGLATPLVTTLFFNLVIPQRSNSLLLEVSVLLLGAAAALGVLSWTRNIALLRLEGVLQQEMEPAIWNHMLRLPSGFFRQFTAGDLVNRVQGIDTIRQLIGGSVLNAFLTLIFSVVNLAILFVYSPQLGVVVLVVVIVMMVLLAAINIANIRNQRDGFTAIGGLFGFLFQLLGAVPKIRVAGAEPQLVTQWAAQFRVQQLASYRSGRIAALSTALSTSFATLITTVVVIFGGMVLRDELSSGAFLGFLSAAGMFTGAVAGMAFAFGPLGACVPLFERLQPILDEEPEQKLDAINPGVLAGSIVVRDVAFRYSSDAPLVLDGFNLEIKPGEFLAVTGPSGSGKSTILKVILGLETPTSGTVSYDNVELASLDRTAIRRQIGVVMQEARPMPGSILQAIVGQSGSSEAAAWEAVEAVGLADEIRAMPMQMRTMISAGAGQLSGGQLQRILLARALVTKPSIIFFDEATSALDNVAQDRVTQSVKDLNATRLVIAHRLETIKTADRIVVVDAGRVVQSGTYEELASQEGLFRDSVMLETTKVDS